MIIFGENEAKYYCDNYKASGENSLKSIRAYSRHVLKNVKSLREGTSIFDKYRDCSLRNAERCLFLAASHYKMAHKIMIASSSCWAYVTLYYGAYYSANAILGMFGVWINAPWTFIDVAVGNTGQQVLCVRRADPRRPSSLRLITTQTGTHKIFWDLFYKAVRPLHAYVMDPALRFSLNPVNSDTSWQTDRRNDINYDSLTAIDLARDFKRNFKSKRFPQSLPGFLNTQFVITESLTLIAFKYAKDFSLNTDALDILLSAGQRGDKLNKLVFKARTRVSVDNSKQTLMVS